MPAKRSEYPTITHRDLAQPTKRARPFSHPDWIFELKHDGYRVLAIRQGATRRLLSRRGNDLLQWFPEIAAELEKLPDGVIDGELVMLDARGHSEFHKLRGRCAIRGPKRIEAAARAKPAAVFAFDLLVLRGADMRQQPLLKRKTALQRELRVVKRICYVQHIGEGGGRLFAEAERLRLEGIVAKKADAPYRRGRTPNWVKIKTVARPAHRRAAREVERMTSPSIGFVQGRPFFEMVMAFLASTIGLGPVFDPRNPLGLDKDTIAAYRGKVAPDVEIDMQQVHNQCISGTFTANAALESLCCMLLNSAYTVAQPHNDHSPEFEFFRHVRNAASHGNQFNFYPHEPSRPASWRSLTIDHNLKGSANPLYGKECAGATISPADVIALLHDIEQRLP